MPSHYAHYRFGTAVLPNLPGDIRRSIGRFRRLFDVGLHGPDLFYFYHPAGQGEMATLGVKYHEQTGKAFFGRICRAIRMERNEAAKAYLYGVLCHYVLDATMHPFIALTARESGASQVEIESEFDRYLLELDHKLPPDTAKLTKHLKLTEGEYETVAAFYPPATAKTVKNALKATIIAIRNLFCTDGPRRKAMELGMGLLGKEAKGMLLPQKPNPRCSHLDETLLQLYGDAMDLFPDYLQQLQAHMTYSAGLEGLYEKPFG